MDSHERFVASLLAPVTDDSLDYKIEDSQYNVKYDNTWDEDAFRDELLNDSKPENRGESSQNAHNHSVGGSIDPHVLHTQTPNETPIVPKDSPPSWPLLDYSVQAIILSVVTDALGSFQMACTELGLSRQQIIDFKLRHSQEPHCLVYLVKRRLVLYGIEFLKSRDLHQHVEYVDQWGGWFMDRDRDWPLEIDYDYNDPALLDEISRPYINLPPFSEGQTPRIGGPSRSPVGIDSLILLAFKLSKSKSILTDRYRESNFRIDYFQAPKGAIVVGPIGEKLLVRGGKYTILYPENHPPVWGTRQFIICNGLVPEYPWDIGPTPFEEHQDDSNAIASVKTNDAASDLGIEHVVELVQDSGSEYVESEQGPPSSMSDFDDPNEASLLAQEKDGSVTGDAPIADELVPSSAPNQPALPRDNVPQSSVAERVDDLESFEDPYDRDDLSVGDPLVYPEDLENLEYPEDLQNLEDPFEELEDPFDQLEGPYDQDNLEDPQDADLLLQPRSDTVDSDVTPKIQDLAAMEYEPLLQFRLPEGYYIRDPAGYFLNLDTHHTGFHDGPSPPGFGGEYTIIAPGGDKDFVEEMGDSELFRATFKEPLAIFRDEIMSAQLLEKGLHQFRIRKTHGKNKLEVSSGRGVYDIKRPMKFDNEFISRMGNAKAQPQGPSQAIGNMESNTKKREYGLVSDQPTPDDEGRSKKTRVIDSDTRGQHNPLTNAQYRTESNTLIKPQAESRPRIRIKGQPKALTQDPVGQSSIKVRLKVRPELLSKIRKTRDSHP
ncbi:hypothetical protein F4805DRAFT_478812 [Annulohypoxylon moriforme]|nr:hypothetical protein F4805DRAFT_478812 [Annulohypoxylon moriforme]